MNVMDRSEFIKNLKDYRKIIIYGTTACLMTFAAFEIGEEAAESYFHVHGLVTDVQNHQVTVSTRWMDKTVDLSGSPFSTANLSIGQHVKIERNLQGTVINLRTEPQTGRSLTSPPPGYVPAPPTAPADLSSRYPEADIGTILNSSADDQKLSVTGVVKDRLSDDKYLLSDDAGQEIIIDADDRPVPLHHQIKIYGETDIKKDHTEIDVKHLEKIF